MTSIAFSFHLTLQNARMSRTTLLSNAGYLIVAARERERGIFLSSDARQMITFAVYEPRRAFDFTCLHFLITVLDSSQSLTANVIEKSSFTFSSMPFDCVGSLNFNTTIVVSRSQVASCQSLVHSKEHRLATLQKKDTRARITR